MTDNSQYSGTWQARPVAFWKLFEVSGQWAQRRRLSARAAIVTARFILAGVTKI